MHVNVPVLIIGGGPAGLLQAYLLSRLNVKCLIVERYPERLGAPKAHALSPRSLEICRQFGLDVRRIRQLGTKRNDARWVNFLTNLSGDAVGRLPYERMDTGVLEATPEMIHNIPQPVFEQFITENLAKDPNVEIRKGLSFVSLKQDSNGVTATVEERTTGQQFQLRSRYLIACDGARSKVRSELDVESDGEDSYETMMTIHFNAKLRPIVKERVGMLHWLMDPLVSGFIIAYDLSGNQVLITNFDSDKHPVETWNEGLCREVVSNALGTEAEFDVLSYRPWLLSRKVARSYRVGNVFLAGDAAHSFPPTGGLGLNSGLGDVHNLAWKIAAVLQGSASDALLDTYETDRRHVAVVNSIQSVKNGKKIFGLLKTLGVGNSKTIQEARDNLFETIHDPAKKKLIDEGVEDQREHFDNLELHIGYVYGSDEIPPHASRYSPRFTPGARLPHSWIKFSDHCVVDVAPVDVSYVDEFSAEDVKRRQFSTLDLCSRHRFTLILGPPTVEEGDSRNDTIEQDVVQVVRLGRDFDLVEQGDDWAQKAGLKNGSGGGLLVRPDQHILAVFTTHPTPQDIETALQQHLG